MPRRNPKSLIAASACVLLSCPTFAADHTGTSAPLPNRPSQPTQPAVDEKTTPPPERTLVETLRELGRFEGRVQPLKRKAELVLAEDAKAEASHTSNLPVGQRGRKVPVETVIVEQGRADAVLENGVERGVLLQTEDLVQAITTQGRVAMIAGAEQVTVAALEGPALVGKEGKFKPLEEGRLRVFSRRDASVFEKELLPAPKVRTDGIKLALTGTARVSLVASRVRGAHAYRGYVMDQKGKVVGEPIESSDPMSLIAPVPSAGNYWAVTQVVDEFGFVSEPSPPTAVRVLGIENGEEVVRDGLIYLAPGQTARILGQQGLIMRYGMSTEFVPAPPLIGLPEKKPTTVEFRDPNDPKTYAVFRLVPQVLKTSIKIGPKTGTWPKDTLDLSVSMWDGRGQPLRLGEDCTVRVKVGLKEIPVEWGKKEAGGLYAQLPPQPGPGPWVVRVSVVDKEGGELARNFMEVAQTPPPKLDLENLETPRSRAAETH